jgi:hypothetical protein
LQAVYYYSCNWQPGKLAEKSRERVAITPGVAIKVLVKLQLEGCRVAIRVLKIIKSTCFRVATEVLDELQLK